ncbi:putative metalloprotease CJM1_0395 family protein [uncultured Tateyamaria sp.]|uniref:putative metalloprotease CJM1_0395 family protein n=1 Tax=uncultured Tateyamaria sp. TaxID=455651 RepID=UPI002636E16F|nr:putative metalloprotease CJM1_0395 family protein [uncultured Tateyamaria sp.]
MDAGQDSLGGAWDVVAPMIQARQREVAERNAAGLTEAEQETVAAMRARDAEVRAHEQAHARVGGQYASAPSYTYQAGPDGRNYAVGGAVQIDVAPVADDPVATINKMEVVKAAALAPAEPSAADRQVAALADALRAQAVADQAAARAASMDVRV